MTFAPVPPADNWYWQSSWNWRYDNSVNAVRVQPPSSDFGSVEAHLYVADYQAVLYGPEKTQDPELISVTPLAYDSTFSSYMGSVPTTWDTNVKFPVYLQIVADGVVVLTYGGVLWDGDESAVIDTPLAFADGTLINNKSMTAWASWTFEASVFNPGDAALDVRQNYDELSRNTSLFTWIDWGDGSRNPFWRGSSGEIPSFTHTYAEPGTYPITVYCAFSGGAGNIPPTIDGLMVPTLLDTTFFTAVLPSEPTFTQHRRTYTLDVMDTSYFNPPARDGQGFPQERFGDDYMLAVAPFESLRGNGKPRTTTKVTGATFHRPYARMETGYRYSGAGANAITPVDDNVFMRRNRGNLNSPRPVVTEYGAPDDAGTDAGLFAHGDGPDPVWRWDLASIPGGLGYFWDGPYYFMDYLPLTREIGVSYYRPDYANPGITGYDQQTVRCYDADTGVFTRDIVAPQLPDDPGYTNSFTLPEAYGMYGDHEILWASRTGSMWRHNHTTGESILICNLEDLLAHGPSDSPFGSNSYPLGISATGGWHNRLLNVRNDGSLSIVVYGHRQSYVAPPGDTWGASYGGNAWYVITLDRGGRLMAPPCRITAETHGPPFTSPEPWGSDFEDGSIFAGIGIQVNSIVADPDAPYIYVPVTGRVSGIYNENVWQTAVYSLNVLTGAWHRVIWFGHPYLEWNFDVTTWTVKGPDAELYGGGYYGDHHDFRYIETATGTSWATNLPPGTYRLRRPPGTAPTATIRDSDVHFLPNA